MIDPVLPSEGETRAVSQSQPLTEHVAEATATSGAEPSAAFTPGPLIYGDSSMDDPSPGPKWEVYINHKGATAYCFKRADAQLYAAAPDMVTALQAVELWLTAALECPTWNWDGDQHDAAQEARDAARTAISKALATPAQVQP